MKLPLKVEYACRVLVQLEPGYRSGAIRRVEDLAADEKISANYLVQILTELRNAGLVDSRRGKNGGYLLVKDPSEVTLLEIVRAVEGPFMQVNSTGEGASGGRVTRVWEKVFEAFDRELGNYTLADIAQHETSDIMCHI